MYDQEIPQSQTVDQTNQQHHMIKAQNEPQTAKAQLK